jgi:hypothetical protein
MFVTEVTHAQSLQRLSRHAFKATLASTFEMLPPSLQQRNQNGCSFRKKGVVVPVVLQQRSLHATLAYFPTTADSAQFCLLCCQPEPIPGSFISCQDFTVSTMESLQTICLVRVGHPHGVQDLLQSLALHHPTPIRVTGAHDCPQLEHKLAQTLPLEPHLHIETYIEIRCGLISLCSMLSQL